GGLVPADEDQLLDLAPLEGLAHLGRPADGGAVAGLTLAEALGELPLAGRDERRGGGIELLPERAAVQGDAATASLHLDQSVPRLPAQGIPQQSDRSHVTAEHHHVHRALAQELLDGGGDGVGIALPGVLDAGLEVVGAPAMLWPAADARFVLVVVSALAVRAQSK